MSENTLRGPIEAILMVASEPVAASDLADVLGASVEDVEARSPLNTWARGRIARAASSFAR